MNKKAKITIALLVILNIVLMAFLYFGNPGRHRMNEPGKRIVEVLNFDKNQQEELNELAAEHHKKARKLQDEIAQLKTTLYQGINEGNLELKDSLINVIGQKFILLEEAHYEHFSGIKDICREDQKAKFQKFTEQLHTIFTPQNEKRRLNKKH